MIESIQDRFLEKIKNSEFTSSELQGLKSNLELALLYGMGIGYQMGSEDTRDILQAALSKLKEND